MEKLKDTSNPFFQTMFSKKNPPKPLTLKEAMKIKLSPFQRIKDNNPGSESFITKLRNKPSYHSLSNILSISQSKFT